MPDGSMHLPQAYLAAHGLPSMSLHPNEAGLSVRTGECVCRSSTTQVVGRLASSLLKLGMSVSTLQPSLLPKDSLHSAAGTRFYLHALPNGQVLAGGPGLAEHDLVLIRPGAEIQYGGPDGIVIQAQQQGKAILPQTGRETAFLAVGAALPMIVLAPWHFRRFWLSC